MLSHKIGFGLSELGLTRTVQWPPNHDDPSNCVWLCDLLFGQRFLVFFTHLRWKVSDAFAAGRIRPPRHVRMLWWRPARFDCSFLTLTTCVALTGLCQQLPFNFTSFIFKEKTETLRSNCCWEMCLPSVGVTPTKSPREIASPDVDICLISISIFHFSILIINYTFFWLLYVSLRQIISLLY